MSRCRAGRGFGGCDGFDELEVEPVSAVDVRIVFLDGTVETIEGVDLTDGIRDDVLHLFRADPERECSEVHAGAFPLAHIRSWRYVNREETTAG